MVELYNIYNIEIVNKRLTQYGKARELKPFDEFVLFPLFLSSLCAFS